MGLFDFVRGSTKFGEKATGIGEWLGIFGLVDQEKVDKYENYGDVADKATKALEDGFQLSDIAEVGGTAAAAYADHKVTTMGIGDKLFGWVPLIGGVLARAVNSYLGNKAQDIIEDIFDGPNDAISSPVAENKANTKDIADRLGITGKYDELDGVGNNHKSTKTIGGPNAAGDMARNIEQLVTN